MPVYKIRWVNTLTPSLRADGTSPGGRAAAGAQREYVSPLPRKRGHRAEGEIRRDVPLDRLEGELHSQLNQARIPGTIDLTQSHDIAA